MDALCLAPSIVTAPAHDGYLAYHVTTGRLHHLNPTAALVLEVCDGSRGLPEIEKALRPLVGESRWPACRDWIDAAVGEGLFVHSSGEGGDERVSSPQALAALASALRDHDAVLAAFVCQHRAVELCQGGRVGARAVAVLVRPRRAGTHRRTARRREGRV